MANVNQIMEKQRRAALVKKVVESFPKPKKTRKQQLREIVLDLLAGRAKIPYYEIDQFAHLKIGVAEVLRRRSGGGSMDTLGDPRLEGEDADILLEIFWDLFREGVITLGLNATNPEFPRFRIHSEAKKF
jgi:hypothetical protein